MKKRNYIDTLLRAHQSVFITSDIGLIWGEDNASIVTNRLKQYVRAGKLHRIRRGIYAKDINYNKYELATRICIPSYISFETVLKDAGAIFQPYKDVYVATYVSRQLYIDDTLYKFFRLPPDVLRSISGVKTMNGVSVAVPERALLDKMYIDGDIHLDNPSVIDWGIVSELMPTYGSKRLAKQVARYRKVLIDHDK
jgi:hypothetical protein